MIHFALFVSPNLLFWPQLFKRWINLYPVDNTIGVPNTYPLDSDLSGGECYLTFEQPGPVVYNVSKE